jgi:hypothetical protein
MELTVGDGEGLGERTCTATCHLKIISLRPGVTTLAAGPDILSPEYYLSSQRLKHHASEILEAASYSRQDSYPSGRKTGGGSASLQSCP